MAFNSICNKKKSLKNRLFKEKHKSIDAMLFTQLQCMLKPHVNIRKKINICFKKNKIMSEKEIKNPLPTQFSIRLSQEEADYINENLHLLRGDDELMPRSKLFVNAVTRAISNIKPKEIVKEVPLPEMVQENEQLKSIIEQLKTEIEKAQNANQIPEGARMIQLKPQFDEYLWGITEIAKRDGYAKDISELIEKMLIVFWKRGEFILDEKDKEYLRNLKNENHD